MMTKQPRVLISIINWNSAERVLQCIEQLRAQDYLHRKIVVVDNASQSHSLQALKSTLSDDVHLIESPRNDGYAGGHAHGVQIALEEGFDCFWLLNTDITLQSDTLSKFVEAYLTHGEYTIYGGVPLERAMGKSLDAYHVLIHRKYLTTNYREILFAPNTRLRFGELFDELTPHSVTALSGSSMFIPLTVIQQYGFMDTDYFMYSEEIDYCFRLREVNIQSIIVPSAYMLHDSEGTTRSHKRLHSVILYYRLRNQLVRIGRYQSSFAVWRAVIKNLCLLMIYPLLQGRSGLEKSWFGLRATWHGLRGQLGKTYEPEDYLA